MIQHHLSIRTETKTKILVAYITRTAPLNWNSTNQRWIFSPTFFVSNFYLLVNSIIELHFVNPWGHQFSLRFIVRFSYYWLLTRYIYFFFFCIFHIYWKKKIIEESDLVFFMFSPPPPLFLFAKLIFSKF